jgi:type VII secretion protein EccB
MVARPLIVWLAGPIGEELMPSRQDQLHSYQFMVQRVVSALVMRETDPARSPFRRIAGSTLIGALLAALALGGVAAYAVVRPAGAVTWRDETAVIVEKETGALYVYRDQLLHPVFNYASALLVLGTPAKTISVSRSSLADAPRGPAWGIPGAPASLPAADHLVGGAWTVCSGSVLFVGGFHGGTPLGDRGTLVRGGTDTYLLWRGHKHLLRDADAVLAALVWNNRTPPVVAGALLNALPTGTDLAEPAITGRGTSAATPPGAKVGQVYAVKRDQGGADFFVATSDHLASITPLQADLLLADPVPGQRAATELTRPDFARYTHGTTIAPEGGDLPVAVPDLVDPGTVCADVSAAGATLVVDVAMPDLRSAVTTTPSASTLADRIVVPPGRGVLVRLSTGGLSLVTDAGKRFPFVSDDPPTAFGYTSAQAVTLPSALVSLVPAGPALDPLAARH